MDGYLQLIPDATLSLFPLSGMLLACLLLAPRLRSRPRTGSWVRRLISLVGLSLAIASPTGAAAKKIDPTRPHRPTTALPRPPAGGPPLPSPPAGAGAAHGPAQLHLPPWEEPFATEPSIPGTGRSSAWSTHMADPNRSAQDDGSDAARAIATAQENSSGRPKQHVHPAIHTRGKGEAHVAPLFERERRIGTADPAASDRERELRAKHACMQRHPAGRSLTGSDSGRDGRDATPARPHCHDGRRGFYTVRPGDTLWDIAAGTLQTDDIRRIARYWPRVHRANRAVIGDTPDLIYPGQRLELPAESGR